MFRKNHIFCHNIQTDTGKAELKKKLSLGVKLLPFQLLIGPKCFSKFFRWTLDYKKDDSRISRRADLLGSDLKDHNGRVSKSSSELQADQRQRLFVQHLSSFMHDAFPVFQSCDDRTDGRFAP